MALWRANRYRPVVHAGISPGTSGAESRSSAYSIKRMAWKLRRLYFLASYLFYCEFAGPIYPPRGDKGDHAYLRIAEFHLLLEANHGIDYRVVTGRAAIGH
jgi:hypothetical protein